MMWKRLIMKTMPKIKKTKITKVERKRRLQLNQNQKEMPELQPTRWNIARKARAKALKSKTMRTRPITLLRVAQRLWCIKRKNLNNKLRSTKRRLLQTMTVTMTRVMSIIMRRILKKKIML